MTGKPYLTIGRYLRLIVLHLVISWCLPAHAAGFSEIDGFRNFRWGDPPTYAMDSLGKRGGMEVFFIPEEVERPVAGVKIASIEYLYDRGGLCRVEVKWHQPLDREEIGGLLTSLKERWGKPDAARETRYSWLSSNGDVEAELIDTNKDQSIGAGRYWELVVQDPECIKQQTSSMGAGRTLAPATLRL